MNLPKARLLLVDDEAENLKALERTLRTQFEVVGVTTPAEALARLEAESFAVVISDQRMPGMLGTDLLAQVATRHPFVTRVILTAHTETKEILDSINRAQIFRYVTKPWDNQELVGTLQQAVDHHRLRVQNRDLIQELEEKNTSLVAKEAQLLRLNTSLESIVLERTQELRRVNERLSELAMTDPLTRIANRRAFFMKFNDEIARSKRYDHPLVIAMIDLDHFKTFNDMEGHVYGDEALRKAAQLITSCVRRTDTVGRYGGEEFIVLMPETQVSNAVEICERLRNQFERTVFQGQHDAAYLTVSIGLAGFPEKGESPEAIVKAADRALYAAKQNGRNQVVSREPDASFFARS